MIREPVVSGQFYPANNAELQKLIESFKPKEAKKMSAVAVILPHAGYVYSGKVAVTTVSKILPKKRIVILGPKHSPYGEDYALWAMGSWNMPFGQVQIDEDLARQILVKGNYIKENYLAHESEHSIEVELPVLNYFFSEFKFVPIACQVSSLETYHAVAEQIYEGLKSVKEEVLLVASTDMTHYEPDLTARKKDRQALEYIVAFDAEGLVKKVTEDNITMCGIAPVAILLSCLKRLGARKAQVALYETSADSSGDYSSVVGYAGLIFS